MLLRVLCQSNIILKISHYIGLPNLDQKQKLFKLEMEKGQYIVHHSYYDNN